MSKLYPEQGLEQKQQRIKYYRKTEMLSVPQDYFEEMKQRLGTEFKQMHVEKNTCARVCAITLSQLESLKEQIAIFNERLDKIESMNQGEEIEAQSFAIIPEDEAAEKISAFINTNPGARTSDIICELGIDPNLTLKVLRKLQEESKIIGKQVERK